MKILTWNIGSFIFIKYFKYLGIKNIGNQPIENEYFQPILNGKFVSEQIREIDPDILFLEEFYTPDDSEYIPILKDYPYKKFINAWYRKDTILIASKEKIEIKMKKPYLYIISCCRNIHFIPVHLNSFQASIRLSEIKTINGLLKKLKNTILLGDVNIWSHGKVFLFKEDKILYKKLTTSLKDFSEHIKSTTFIGFSLDKIFGDTKLNIKNVKVIKKRGRYMDHYPLYAELD